MELETLATDDRAFVELAGRLIDGAARTHGFDKTIVAHVNHWFGPRWLGFCGKIFGIAGVRMRRLSGRLTPPPFHPHRIRSVCEYALDAVGTLDYRGDVTRLHGFQPSGANVYRSLGRGALYAWYSGDTVVTDRAAVMVYLMHYKWSAAWYAEFRKQPNWRLSHTRSISPRRIAELLAMGSRLGTSGRA